MSNIIKKIKDYLFKVRPSWSYYWWWRIRGEEFYDISMVLIKAFTFFFKVYVPLFIPILTFAIGVLIPVRTKKDIRYVEKVRVDSFWKVKVETLRLYHKKKEIQVDSIFVYQAGKEAEVEKVLKRDSIFVFKEVEKKEKGKEGLVGFNWKAGVKVPVSFKEFKVDGVFTEGEIILLKRLGLGLEVSFSKQDKFKTGGKIFLNFLNF